MRTLYYQVAVLNEGLRRFQSVYGRQLFTRRKLRKVAECATCGRTIKKGEEAWGEMASMSLNRRHRVHLECVVKEETETLT